MNIFERVFQDIKITAHLPALKWSGNTITRNDLYSSILLMVREVFHGHLDNNERVMILLPNCPQFVISFFAIVHAGGVAVVADYQVKNELYSIIKDNRINKVITDSYWISKISKMIANNSADELDGLNDLDIISSESIEICKDKFVDKAEASSNDNALSDPVMIFYTSGSTSKPKAIINSNDSLIGEVRNYLSSFTITPDDRLIAVSPFSHIYAFSTCMLVGLAADATLLLSGTFIPRQILRSIAQDKATIFHGVPFMYDMLNQLSDLQKYELNSLRLCISTGAPLPKAVAETFYRLTGIIIHQQYGSSETGAISLNQSNDMELNIKSVGKPLDNIKIRVVNKDEEDGTGSIQIKSPALSVGYVGEEPFRRGWYSTGDLGKVDRKGFLYITGREKRMINIASLKVNPAEIEHVLADYPGVKDVLVKGTKHETYGEIVEAYIVPQGEKLSEGDIISFCRERLSPFKVPSKVHFVEALDKSSLGKIRY